MVTMDFLSKVQGDKGMSEFQGSSEKDIWKSDDAAMQVSASSQRKLRKLTEAQQAAMVELLAYLEQHSYSKSTIRSYGNAFLLFLQAFPDVAPKDLDVGRIQAWIAQRNNAKAARNNTLVSVIQLYFQQFSNPKFELERPKYTVQAPKILSKKEVQRLIDACENLKHKCLLLFTYSAGLRLMEVLAIKCKDIDLERRTILIRSKKQEALAPTQSRNDRLLPIPIKLAKLMEAYLEAYEPQTWLFEGQQAGSTYSERSAQEVMKRAAKQAGLKGLSIKVLRASYGAHQLEAGLSTNAVQELMGFSSHRATVRYAKVAKRKPAQSPGDDLEI